MNRDQIMASEKLSDMEKLKLIFDMDKDRLHQYFPSLYYTILAVLDEHKKPDASGYFGVQPVKCVKCKDCAFYKPYPKPVEDFDGLCTVTQSQETDEDRYCSWGITQEELNKIN